MIFNSITRKIIASILCLLITGAISAQHKNNSNLVHRIQIGAEVQWYPAGWIIGPVANFLITPRHIINVRTATNITNRHDWSGKNDNEKGKGYGGSLGYRYIFTPDKNSFYIGVRADLWRMKIDWENYVGTLSEIKGRTKIWIFQPSAEFGYKIISNNEKWNLLFSSGVGKEINIRTSGKEVGEGGMWLLGASAYFSL